MPGFPRLQEAYDLVIVGGGHAGLEAGLKAGLLHHTAAVIDRGPKYSRSYYAPRMDNIPGFPLGISGHALLDLQVAQLRNVEARVGYFTPARAHRAERLADGGFRVEFDWLKQARTVRGRALVLAMGVVDRMPVIAGKIDTIFPWANAGIVDFCLFCDGHNLPGKSVAVLGADRFAALSALDLLHFGPASLELLTLGHPFLGELPEAERSELALRVASAGITVRTPEAVGLDGIREKRLIVRFSDGTTREYDKGFSALGWYDMHQELPRSLGATFDPDGYVVTDEDCRVLDATGTPVPGLYCIGDLRNGWNQIPEAWATADRAVIHAYSYYL
ncbi:MAG TPA: NAD(P)/FAD-dependent oxidoreductase [Thermoplasmata archaeon]|nr:NAD(P)/FAD-dependent oxidoreductase [Thermoplasmata archaeon]